MHISPEDLWWYYGRPNHIVVITTNAFIKSSGELVMGRGAAYQATQKVPGIAKLCGDAIRKYRNQEYGFLMITRDLGIFQVKVRWWDDAGVGLIRFSAEILAKHASAHPLQTFHLNYPGIGNGRLTVKQVEPAIQVLPDNVIVHKKQR